MHRQPLIKPSEHRLVAKNVLSDRNVEKAHRDPRSRHPIAVGVNCGLGCRDQTFGIGVGHLGVERGPALSL